MALDTDLAAQERILDELSLRNGRLADREAVVERVLGGVFLVLAVGLALSGGLMDSSLVVLAGATLTFAVAARVEFDVPGGVAVPTQLAFVPLLFVAPATLVPLL